MNSTRRLMNVLRWVVCLLIIKVTIDIARIEGEWTYPLAAWVCWLVPLTVFELAQKLIATRKRCCSDPD